MRSVGAVERPRDQRVGGDVGDQVVGGDQDPPLCVPEDRVGGAVAGPVQGLQGAVAEGDLLAVGAAAASPRRASPSRGSCARRSAARRRPPRGCRCAASARPRSASSRSASSPKLASRSAANVERRDLGAGVLDDDLDQAEVVDVLVGDDHQLEVVDRVAALLELALQLVQRLARVGPGVDQGQRLVLDQVAVDPPDRERGRDAQAVDAGQRRLLQSACSGVSVTPGSAPGPRRASLPCPRARPATRG